MDKKLLTKDVINLISYHYELDKNNELKEDIPEFNYFDKDQIKKFFLHVNTLNDFLYYVALYQILETYTGRDINIYDNLIITSVEQFGGEGLGSDYYVIFKMLFNNEETFWKIPGWYQSFQGSELEVYNTFQVVPKEKTITVFEQLK